MQYFLFKLSYLGTEDSVKMEQLEKFCFDSPCILDMQI